MTTVEGNKRKPSLVAAPDIWKVQRGALDTALKLIEDAKKKKKKKPSTRNTSKRISDLDESSDNKYEVLRKKRCLNTKFSDMRSLTDSELLVCEMRSAFCRWNWDCVVDLLVFAAQTGNRPLLQYARLCFPVLVTQHPSLKTQGRNLIEEAMFAAGVADATEFTNRLFALNEEDIDEDYNETVISKLFSPKVGKNQCSKEVSSSKEEEEEEEEEEKVVVYDDDDDDDDDVDTGEEDLEEDEEEKEDDNVMKEEDNE